MVPRFLLDTHIVVRWLAEPKRLSRDQARILSQAVRRNEPMAIAAISMLEIAVLLGDDSHRIKAAPEELFSEFEMNPIFRILPLTIEVAKEVTMLGGALRDPADRAIVASARVHRLRLLTSDRRIIESNLVSVVV